TLLVVKIHFRVGLNIKRVLMYVADDAYDRVPGSVWALREPFTECIASGKETRHCLIDNSDQGRASHIVVVQLPPPAQRHSQRLEVFGTNDAIICHVLMPGGWRQCTFNIEHVAAAAER